MVPAMCDERERLIGYVYDECDAAERRAIDAHLESCGVCRDEIRALRGVREDLLAWDVPEHGSVWRPFAPARVTPWWREVPAWAMAVAATLVFLLGALGGSVTHTFMLRDTVQAAPAPAIASAAAPATSAAVVPVSLSPAEQAAFEQRILAHLDQELDQRIQQVSVSSGGSKMDPQVARELRELRASLDTQKQNIFELMNDFNTQLIVNTKAANQGISKLGARVDAISYSVPGGNK
jgi:anti-sigma factor RsiW